MGIRSVKSVPVIPKDFVQEIFGVPGLTWSNLWKKRLVKQKPKKGRSRNWYCGRFNL